MSCRQDRKHPTCVIDVESVALMIMAARTSTKWLNVVRSFETKSGTC